MNGARHDLARAVSAPLTVPAVSRGGALREVSPPPDGPVVCHITTVHDALDPRIFLKECRTLAAAGYRTVLIAPHTQSEHRDGVEIRAIERRRGRLGRVVMAQLDVIRTVRAVRPRPALVHIHDPELLPLARVLRVWGTQVIFDVHEDMPVQIMVKEYIPRPLRAITAGAYRLIEPVLTRGITTVHVMETIARGYAGRREVVRNFPLVVSTEPARRERLPDARPRLVYVGSTSRLRGLLTMVEVVAALRHLGRETELRVIGGINDPRLQRELSELVERNNLHQSVTLLGRMPHDAAQAEIAQGTLGLCLLHDTPGYRNSLPTKILEYMNAGLPVVASDFPAWREYVADSGAGVMVDVGDVRSVAQAIVRLLDDAAARREMGQKGIAAVRGRYNWAAEGRTLLRLYGDLIGPPATMAQAASR
jgi:glycosyltransferase involved in cell wall biosynthesis